MIEEITIRNLGVIEHAVLPLSAGFTAVTGETGAGKTMVVTALGLLLGARSESSVVRNGSASAQVEGVWVIDADGPVASRVADAGGEVETLEASSEAPHAERAQLIVGRTVTSEGRSRASVGGRSAPAGVLSEIGEQLVAVHGQSDQLRLKSAVAQREIIDRFAGEPFAAASARYAEEFHRWSALRAERDLLITDRERRSREAHELQLALDEIEQAAPQPGEDAELDALAERLTNLDELVRAAADAHESLSSESDSLGSDAATLIESARRQIDRVSAHDSALAEIAEHLASLSFQVSEVAGQLASYLSGLDTDSANELESVQERRAQLVGLIRKHGETLDDVLAFAQTGSARLFELSGDNDRIDQLATAAAESEEQVLAHAAELTRLRTEAARTVSERVTAELTALAMPDAELLVQVAATEELSAHGADRVSIMLRPHSGAEPRPLGKGASGGELSRVMLALEVVIADSGAVPTLIFDEVDAGVGGAAAIEVGRRLAELARTSQVIVVTHLAQVAAFATNHLTVVKNSDGQVTASSVQQLQGEQRLAEMARLLSGLSDSGSALAHAQELLELAHHA